MINEFKNLSENRKLWVETTKSNGFDNGIKNLLTELYPDNAHFIYELLQNAEDTGATEVKFILKSDELIFQHNGRDFNFKDIEGITSIGQGTKKDDINKIGKFGVGFKAVFAYTNTPFIYSNKFNFSINDLVIPVEIDKRNYDYPTTMIFPFNNKNKLSIKAYEEIEKGLNSIQDNTLLFLKNINTIKYEYKDILNEIKRDELDEIKIIITNKVKNEKTIWLRFKKFLSMSSNLFVSIAYKIEENIETKKEQLVPIDGEVSIYFPAEKETSKLKFHIHAPFSSTVARDSIKDIEENNELRDLISILFCESLEFIKKNKLLNSSFFECMPILDDNLSPFYLPILNSIRNLFNENEYLLSDNNDFISGNNCQRTSKELKEFLTIELLKNIKFRNISQNKTWLKSVNRLNSREDKFLKMLNIKEITIQLFMEEFYLLAKRITEINFMNVSDKQIIKKEKQFLESQEDVWFTKFYLILINNIKELKKHYKESFKYFLKLSNNSLNSKLESCFFSENYIEGFNILKREIYLNKNGEPNYLIIEFLRNFLNVNEINKKVIIEQILVNNYNTLGNIAKIEEHFKHLKLFLEYYNENDDCDIFKNYYFILSQKNIYNKTTNLYLTLPYENNNLYIFQYFDEFAFISEIYKEKLTDKELKIFIQFLKDLNINVKLKIIEQRIPYSHPKLNEMKIETGNKNSTYSISMDYYIENFSTLLNLKNKQIALYIWDLIRNEKTNILTATYQPNRKSLASKKDSSLVIDLKNSFWIPDKNGFFNKPEDLTLEMLDEEFIFDDRNKWLTKIGFANKNLNRQNKEKEEYIKEITNLSINILEQIKEVGLTDDDISRLIEKKMNKLNLEQAILNHNKDIEKRNIDVNLPIIIDSESLQNQEIKNIKRNIEKGLSQEKVNKYSRNNSKIGKNDIKFFLYEQYKGYCQICGFTFELKDTSKNYFEIFDWFNNLEDIELIEKGSSLCLCPNCHTSLRLGDFESKFLENFKKNDTYEEFCTKSTINNIKNIEIPECFNFIEMDMYKIPIRILNNNKYIFYSEEHFLHFYNILTLK